MLPGLYAAERAVYVLLAVLFFALVGFTLLILGFFRETFASPGVSFRLSVATLISFYVRLLIGDAVIAPPERARPGRRPGASLTFNRQMITVYARIGPCWIL